MNSVSAHGGLHADTLICSLLGSFSCFQFMHDFGTTNCKTSGTPEFFKLVRFAFVRQSVLQLLGNLLILLGNSLYFCLFISILCLCCKAVC